MPLNHAGPGFDFMPAYACPALPWVTSSIVNGTNRHDFGKVTKFFNVKNTGGVDIYISFTLNGLSTGHYVKLVPTESVAAEVRIKTLYVSGSSGEYSLFAGLTTIDETKMPILTGSGNNPWYGIG
jgi:hypothetical protein